MDTFCPSSSWTRSQLLACGRSSVKCRWPVACSASGGDCGEHEPLREEEGRQAGAVLLASSQLKALRTQRAHCRVMPRPPTGCHLSYQILRVFFLFTEFAFHLSFPLFLQAAVLHAQPLLAWQSPTLPEGEPAAKGGRQVGQRAGVAGPRPLCGKWGF